MAFPLLNLDVPTLIRILITGNILSALLVLAYYHCSLHGKQWKNSRNVILAKLFQASGFLFISLRGGIPDLLSANLGNSLLFMGFYFEALAMVCMVGENRRAVGTLGLMVVVSILFFNSLDMVFPDPATRVITASACVFAILLVPCLRLLLSPTSSGFKQLVGALYTCFLALLVPRVILAIIQPAGVLDNTPVQALTYHTLVLLMMFSLASYLLLVKEHEDNTLTVLATTDWLTGLPNRHNFFEAAEKLFTRYRYEGNPVGMLFMDIDHFKAINDQYGHMFGDAVLEMLSRIIRDKVRPFDLMCRYGGEEFVVLLPDADAAGAAKVAERIREAVGLARIDANPSFRFSISIGVSADVPKEGDSLETLINQADQAMYSAKNSGRNQVMHFHKTAS